MRKSTVAISLVSLASLTASVAELGVLQPILVREVGDERYELIAGERRWRAAKRAGLPSIPVVVRTVDEVLSLEQALFENLHREDLNPLEEAAAYQQLMEDFELTQEAVAQKVGKSRSAVANTLRLFQLTPAILITGIVFAGVMGLIGGLLPALRAARMPITRALRDA